MKCRLPANFAWNGRIYRRESPRPQFSPDVVKIRIGHPTDQFQHIQRRTVAEINDSTDRLKTLDENDL